MLIKIFLHLWDFFQDFLCSPVVRTLCFHCRGHGVLSFVWELSCYKLCSIAREKERNYFAPENLYFVYWHLPCWYVIIFSYIYIYIYICIFWLSFPQYLMYSIRLYALWTRSPWLFKPLHNVVIEKENYYINFFLKKNITTYVIGIKQIFLYKGGNWSNKASRGKQKGEYIHDMGDEILNNYRKLQS